MNHFEEGPLEAVLPTSPISPNTPDASPSTPRRTLGNRSRLTFLLGASLAIAPGCIIVEGDGEDDTAMTQAGSTSSGPSTNTGNPDDSTGSSGSTTEVADGTTTGMSSGGFESSTDNGSSTTEGDTDVMQPFEVLGITPPVCADVDPGECGFASTNRFSIQYQGDMPMIEDPESPGEFIPDIQAVFSHDPPDLGTTFGTIVVVNCKSGECILEYTATSNYGIGEDSLQESVNFTIGGQHHDGFSFFIVNPAID